MALGDDLATVSRDAGHADMSVTYRIYTHVMRLEDDEREQLRALIEGSQLAAIGSRGESDPLTTQEPDSGFRSTMHDERA
jgi:hypothetical protein